MRYPQRLRTVLVDRLASGELTATDTITVSGEKVPVKTVAKHFGINIKHKADIKEAQHEGLDQLIPPTDQPSAA